ncbi:MAG: hypothetical protein Q9169_002466 [Polycauliona sp. 2 TL-2023]
MAGLIRKQWKSVEENGAAYGKFYDHVDYLNWPDKHTYRYNLLFRLSTTGYMANVVDD